MRKSLLFGIALAAYAAASASVAGKIFADVENARNTPIGKESRRLREEIFQARKTLEETDFPNRNFLDSTRVHYRIAEAESLAETIEENTARRESITALPEFQAYIEKVDEQTNKAIYGLLIAATSIAAGYMSVIKFKGGSIRANMQEIFMKQIQKDLRKKLEY